MCMSYRNMNILSKYDPRPSAVHGQTQQHHLWAVDGLIQWENPYFDFLFVPGQLYMIYNTNIY